MTGALFLSALDSEFAQALQMYDAWLQQFGAELRIVNGFRSFAEQWELYQKGRTPNEIANHVRKQGRDGAVTDALPGQSAHNYGLAVDIDPDYPYTREIVQVAKLLGFGTVSWDPDHIEYPNWQQRAAAR